VGPAHERRAAQSQGLPFHERRAAQSQGLPFHERRAAQSQGLPFRATTGNRDAARTRCSPPQRPAMRPQSPALRSPLHQSPPQAQWPHDSPRRSWRWRRRRRCCRRRPRARRTSHSAPGQMPGTSSGRRPSRRGSRRPSRRGSRRPPSRRGSRRPSCYPSRRRSSRCPSLRRSRCSRPSWRRASCGWSVARGWRSPLGVGGGQGIGGRGDWARDWSAGGGGSPSIGARRRGGRPCLGARPPGPVPREAAARSWLPHGGSGF
jgi:hypothetical protein